MVFWLVPNDCYLLLHNVQACGFFRLSSDVKNGYPFSPILFILDVEVFSRGLNALHVREWYKRNRGISAFLSKREFVKANSLLGGEQV